MSDWEAHHETSSLSFPFRGRNVPVTYNNNVISRREATLALQSDIFKTWYRRCEKTTTIDNDDDSNNNKRIEIHGVEIQSVDLFGARGVGFVKIKSDCTLIDGETQHHEHRLPGICFLRGNSVAIFVALYCDDDDDDDENGSSVYSLLVDQPRVPTGQVSSLELPAGMIDDDDESVSGIAIREMEEECGIHIKPGDLIDLTELMAACQEDGIPPSPGGCDEFIRYMYLEKKVTAKQLNDMRGRLAGLREHGEFITLKVVPMKDVWKMSADAKVMISMFLVDQLRREGKLPAAGELATPLVPPEPVIKLSNGTVVPQLAFGLYKIPATEEGEMTILNAVAAGYRHFDTASFYKNEAMLGRALKKTNLKREEFFIASKVWNDAVKGGRATGRQSVEKSLTDLDFGGYFDLFLIHWPVPGHFVDAYKELEELCKEGKIRAIGLSNFGIEDYEELVREEISIAPVVNQIEVSPVMYRPKLIEFFQSKDIAISAYKPLNRGTCFELYLIAKMAEKHSVTPAQVMLRWGLQKGLIVVAKTATRSRMRENRSILNFALSTEDMALLDTLTTEEDVKKREQHEIVRKTSL